ncbi:unnamed protein product [Cyprideis torosa]|uniref:Uncharacterized protein n=1 Tax=Cyprideis torosa TaxID=163714 RepID=A0A7R8ZLM3_9CRUS|nr:unnamed protein product [Cyprideis torosa]CAG0892174.1 unnamed protein product [Cyprideis torosa]
MYNQPTYPPYGQPPPIYPAQPGYAPQGGYQPHDSYPAQPGFPQPAYGMPAGGFGPQPGVIPLRPNNETSGAYRTNDPERGGQHTTTDTTGTFGASFGSKAIRNRFVRKVYSILSVQLAVTVAMIAIAIFAPGVKEWLRRNIWCYYISYVIFLVTYITIVCCESVRRKHPTNLIVLAVFTLALGFMTAMISSFHDTRIVFYTMGITAIVVFAVTIFAMQTKYDITGCGGFLCIASLVVFVFGIVTMITWFVDPQTARIMQVVYAGVAALLFCMFLLYDTQQIVGGRAVEISEEEHVFAALQLYVDIVIIFMSLLMLFLMYDTQQIMGGRKIELSEEEHVLGAIQLYVDIVYIFLMLLQILSFFGGSD